MSHGGGGGKKGKKGAGFIFQKFVENNPGTFFYLVSVYYDYSFYRI